MKRQTVIGPLLVVAMASGVYCETAGAEWGKMERPEPPGGCRGEDAGGGRGFSLARMARELGLSDEQKSQVRKVLAAERETVGPLLKKLHTARELVAEARDGAKFDEAALRAAAERENGIRTELLVAHARSRSRINAQLTPEQRELAEDLALPRHLPGKGPLPPEGF